MTYNEDFKAVVKTGNYIGTGNPNAKILIIGCECAIGKDRDSKQYKDEIEGNALNWQKNINYANRGVRVEIADNRSDINPLYPFKGQIQKWYREKKDKNGNVIKKYGEGGTSRTWLNYQKLYNEIFDYSAKEAINFHEKIFITEFSTITAPSKRSIIEDKTLNEDGKTLKEQRQESIKKRAKIFKDYEFFQKFPIVIVATGGAPYVDNNNVKLWKIFNVDYKEVESRKIKEENGKAGKVYYNIHRNKIGQSPKLVIHTWQFGACISNVFLETIALLCRTFIKENKIELS